MNAATLAIYQPLIVGLGAVVLGLIANTLLEWFRHQLGVRHQRASVRRALVSELTVALETARHNRDSVKSAPENGQDFLRMPIRECYPAFDWAMPSLGLLRTQEVAAVFVAYDYLRSWPEIIGMIGKLEREDGRLFGHVHSSNWEIVRLAAEDRVRILGRTVDLLGEKLPDSNIGDVVRAPTDDH